MSERLATARVVECPLCGERALLASILDLCHHLREAHPGLAGGHWAHGVAVTTSCLGAPEFRCYCGEWHSIGILSPPKWHCQTIEEHWRQHGGLAAHVLELLLLGKEEAGE